MGWIANLNWLNPDFWHQTAKREALQVCHGVFCGENSVEETQTLKPPQRFEKTQGDISSIPVELSIFAGGKRPGWERRKFIKDGFSCLANGLFFISSKIRKHKLQQMKVLKCKELEFQASPGNVRSCPQEAAGNIFIKKKRQLVESTTKFEPFSSISSWWLNQPLWKILVKLDDFPGFGVKIKTIWVATT